MNIMDAWESCFRGWWGYSCGPMSFIWI